MDTDSEHHEPTPDELDRVERLLHGLGDERAPDDVIARLELVLAAQSGAAAPRPHRRIPRLRLRHAIAIGAPIAAAIALVVALAPHGGGGAAGSSTAAALSAGERSAGGAASAAPVAGAPIAPQAKRAAPAAGGTATAAQDTGQAAGSATLGSRAAPDVAAEVRAAALRAYRAGQEAIRRAKAPPQP